MNNQRPLSPTVSNSSFRNCRDNRNDTGLASTPQLLAFAQQKWSTVNTSSQRGKDQQPWNRVVADGDETENFMPTDAIAGCVRPGYLGTFPRSELAKSPTRIAILSDSHDGGSISDPPKHRMHEENLLLLEDARAEAERASMIAEAAQARYRIILEYVQKNTCSSQSAPWWSGSESFFNSQLPPSAGIGNATRTTLHRSHDPMPRSTMYLSPSYSKSIPRGMHSLGGSDVPPNSHHFLQSQVHQQALTAKEKRSNVESNKTLCGNRTADPQYGRQRGCVEKTDESHPLESTDSTRKDNQTPIEIERDHNQTNEDPNHFSAGNDNINSKRSMGHKPGEDAPSLPPKKRVKRDPNKPRRPLSAYNIFFSEERAKILNELSDDKDDEKKSRAELPSEAMTRVLSQSESSMKSRKHRKRHGKIAFVDLAKTIGKKWKNLSTEQLDVYKTLANKDAERYREAMKSYKPPTFQNTSKPLFQATISDVESPVNM